MGHHHLLQRGKMELALGRHGGGGARIIRAFPARDKRCRVGVSILSPPGEPSPPVGNEAQDDQDADRDSYGDADNCPCPKTDAPRTF